VKSPTVPTSSGSRVIAESGKANLTAEAEENLKRSYCGLRGCSRIKVKAKSEALAPHSEPVDQGLFQPGTETAFGGFIGFGVVDLEGFS
jgi:hypothetical protein